MLLRQIPLEVAIPGLQNTKWEKKSDQDYHYNCIAFAAGDDHKWWEPSGLRIHYWPPGIPLDYSVDTFVRVYEIFGYKRCDSEHLEAGYEKVALFKDSLGLASHAARQRENGVWVSKL